MAWLEPENFQCLHNFHGHLAWVDACQHGTLLSKSWCFASNNACIQHVASRCTHQHKHASIAGVQGSSGQYLSTLTAEYPGVTKTGDIGKTFSWLENLAVLQVWGPKSEN